MTELPLPAGKAALTRKQLVDCVERELRYRRAFYPRLVGQRKMSMAKMDHEIACMEAIAEGLRAQLRYERKGAIE